MGFMTSMSEPGTDRDYSGGARFFSSSGQFSMTFSSGGPLSLGASTRNRLPSGATW